MKKILFITIITLITLTGIADPWDLRARRLQGSAIAIENLAQKLSGKILLQVESLGEAWYVNPSDQKRYFLNRPKNAFDLMREFGLGIKNKELASYLNSKFPERLLGKIMLDVEKNGEAYYIFPDDLKGYYLGRPADAFNIMRNLGLGITNENLNKINIGSSFNVTPIPSPDPNPNPTPTPQPNNENVIYDAADIIRSRDINKSLTYFIPELQKAVEYSLNFLDDDGILSFANILSGSKLISTTDNKKIYSNEVYFGLGGYEITMEFEVEKQEDGSWLISKI